jgi:hypothetical protein
MTLCAKDIHLVLVYPERKRLHKAACRGVEHSMDVHRITFLHVLQCEGCGDAPPCGSSKASYIGCVLLETKRG